MLGLKFGDEIAALQILAEFLRIKNTKNNDVISERVQQRRAHVQPAIFREYYTQAG